MIGNTRPYSYVIGSGNFTAGQVVGWKFYVFDTAGNLLDPIYTFEVGSAPISTTTTTASTGASVGGGTSITKCQPYANQFGICYYYDKVNSRCAQGCEKGSICNTKLLVCETQNKTITTQNATTALIQAQGGTFTSLTQYFSFDKVIAYFKGLFTTTAPSLSIEPLKEGLNKAGMVADNPKIQKVVNWTNENIYLVFPIVGSIMLVVAVIMFGFGIFTNPVTLALIGFGIITSFVITYYKVFT